MLPPVVNSDGDAEIKASMQPVVRFRDSTCLLCTQPKMVSDGTLNQAAVFVEMAEAFHPLVPVSQLVEDAGLVVLGPGVSDISA